MHLTRFIMSFSFALFAVICVGNEIDKKLAQLSSNAAAVAGSEFTSRKNELLDKRNAAERKIRKTFENELDKLKNSLMTKLETTLDEETKQGNLDAAVELRDVIATVKNADINTLVPEVVNRDQTIAALRQQIESLERYLIVANKEIGESEIAQIEILSGSSGLGELKTNARAFSNRKYHWVGVPEGLAYKHVTNVAGGGSKPLVVKIVSPGKMAVAVGHDSKAVIDYMRKERWRPTSQHFGYSDNKPSLLHIYTKQVEPGIISIPNLAWAGPVVLLP